MDKNKVFTCLLIVLFVVVCGVQSLEAEGKYDKTQCNHLRNEFSNYITDFLGCAIKFSEPVSYCRNCSGLYLNQSIAYKTFVDAPECHAIYVDNDRLNIIETTHSYATNLWNAGSCSECYNTTLDATTKYWALSNSTIEFGKLTFNLNNCSVYSKDATCMMCKSHYDKLNLMYNQMKSKRGESICFDIKDSMNKTRIHWSKTLHCCEDRNSSQFYFFTFASGLCTIAVAFYIGVFVWGRYQERMEYDQLNDVDDDNETQDVWLGDQPSTSTSNMEHAEARYQSVDNELDVPPAKTGPSRSLRQDNPISSSQLFLS